MSKETDLLLSDYSEVENGKELEKMKRKEKNGYCWMVENMKKKEENKEDGE